jgi:hypothetical protein
MIGKHISLTFYLTTQLGPTQQHVCEGKGEGEGDDKQQKVTGNEMLTGQEMLVRWRGRGVVLPRILNERGAGLHWGTLHS